MKFVWMLLSLIIAFVIIYLIWEEFIAKRDPHTESEFEHELEQDIRSLGESVKPHVAEVDASVSTRSAAALTADLPDVGAAVDGAVAEADAAVAEVAAVAADTVDAAVDTVDAAVDATIEVADEIVEDAGDLVDETVAVVAERSSVVVSVGDLQDDLTKVKGIGKVYQGRLNEAGITTWEQVAEADPAMLSEIAKAIDAANVEDWPRQARLLADARNA